MTAPSALVSATRVADTKGATISCYSTFESAQPERSDVQATARRPRPLVVMVRRVETGVVGVPSEWTRSLPYSRLRIALFGPRTQWSLRRVQLAEGGEQGAEEGQALGGDGKTGMLGFS